jgi:hypothetical protein
MPQRLSDVLSNYNMTPPTGTNHVANSAPEFDTASRTSGGSEFGVGTHKNRRKQMLKMTKLSGILESGAIIFFCSWYRHQSFH